MPVEDFNTLTQAALDKSRKEVLAVLQTKDLTPYVYNKAQHTRWGTHDANYAPRLRLARGLQFAPEMDNQEGVEALIRDLLIEEIKDRETNSFQGIGTTVEILATLLKAYERDADKLLFAQIKKANFDCHCGFEAGYPKRHREVVQLDDIEDCIEVTKDLNDNATMSALIDMWIKQQTQWTEKNTRTRQLYEADKKNHQGELEALAQLAEISLLSEKKWEACSALNNYAERLIDLGHLEQAQCTIWQLTPLFESRLAQDPQWLQVNLSKFILMSCMRLIIQQYQHALSLSVEAQKENTLSENKRLWTWVTPHLNVMIATKKDAPWNLYTLGAEAAQIMGNTQFSQQLTAIRAKLERQAGF